MSVELPTDTLNTPYRAYGFDLSSPLSDGTASTRDDGRRRVLECPRLRGADVPTCIAAWHGVLHWLRFNDEPVITCLLGKRAQKCWPITTAVTAETSLGELQESVRKQWPEQDSGWLDLTDPNHAPLLDQLRCHAIRLQDAPDTRQVQSEFALVRKRSSWLTDCAASRFSEAYQRRLMALWKQIVARMVANPASLLSAETYRDDGGEVHKAAGPGVLIGGNLIERFVDAVAQNPQKTAIVDAQGSVTFAGLHAQSSEWAQALRAAGVVPGDCVGVAFNRNSKMAAAQIAVLKVGAVFVPMDANQPATRLQAMVDDTEMRVALTEAACVHAMQSALPGVRCLTVENLLPAPGTPGEIFAGAATDDAAYVVFTSGSTGRPKGVKVSHGNLLNFITYLSGDLDADDVAAQFAPFTFDASVAEIHVTLLNGGRLVILPGELIDDPDRLQAYMTAQQVTFAAFPPQYAKHLSPDRLPLLKTLMTAGSAPNHELIARWQPHVNYINAYGPTETTILSTVWHATYVPQAHEPIVIGAPIANTEVRVVNRFNQCLPPGLVGELWIGGAGVTHGYVKREALTRERFVTLDRIRWYRSGDLCCFDDRSQLIFAGRVDTQFKLRGHRLEPGEVEGALLTVKGVEQAAVVVVEVESVNQLVAFCAGERQPEQAMRESLRQVLPAWALPNRVLWLANLPLTANGKTDYRKLHLQASRVDEPQEQQEYEDELEAQVAAIWGSVLHQPNISRDANFIHLGGDSLTSLVVMSAMKRLGYQVSSSQLLAHPRLADFVRLLQRTGRQVQRDYASCQGIAPLSPIQGWFFSLQLEQPGAFCQTLMFETQERLDAGRLHEAFSKLVVYHDQLRARFVRVAGDAQHAVGWRQEIASAVIELPPIAALDLPEEPLVEASEHFRKLLAAELSIEQEPLFRVVLLRTPDRSRVVWVLHHLIVDTISHGILLDDLRHLYDSAGKDVESVLSGKSISYLGWANKLWTEVTGHAKEHLERWLPVLRGVAQADALPLQGSSNSYRSVEISQGCLSRDDTTLLLDSASRGYRQSPEELVLAATYLALGRELQLQRIAIDIEWHGRDEVFAGPQGIDRTVGWFTSVHPLCMAIPAPSDLGAWLVELKEARAGIPNRGRDFYALRYLSEEPAVRAQFATYRQPQVLFNFSGVVHRAHTGWRTTPVVAIEMGAGDESPYALSVESEIRNGELIVSLFLAPESWPAGVFERLAGAIIECLREVIQHCRVPDNRRWTPSDFPHLSLTQAQADRLPRFAKAAYPLTDMQQTLCRHKDTYQVFMCYRLPCPMDEPAWKSAVADWIGRHDCLRTHIYEWGGGDLCQVVLQDVPLSAVVHRAPVGAGSELAAQIMHKARSAPVVITQAPLFDLHAVDEGGEDFLIVLAIHHLIHDGWSIELLLGDLLETYRYFRGEVDRKPATPLASMADIVAQQRKLQASAEWQAYWVGLPWEPAACQLPTKPQRKASADAQRGTQLYAGVLDQHLVSAVRTRAQALGVTINSLWLTGYVCLLRYLGGQPQVRCGVIQNGRMEDIPGVETITGCCVNTLPLVLNIASSRTCADILAAVNGQLQKMRAAAAFPLSSIHQAVKPSLDDELFSSLFNIESHRYGTHDAQRRATLEGGYESTNYGFIFSLIEQPSNYAVRIGYDSGLYEVESVATWLEIFAQCMQAVTQQTDVPWNALQLLPEKIRGQISQWNQTTREYPDDRCVPELFREQAARRPAHPALLYKDVELNYAQLDARTDELARILRTRGVQPETIVGLVAERSMEMVIAILAIFKAGGAYVPIDPKYPAARVRHMVSDVGCSLVVFQRRSLAQVIPEDLAVTCLYLDEPLAAVPAIALDPTPARHSRQLAYVMYTSGSTGNPKGVMIEHRSIARLVKNTADITFAPDDRILLTSAPGFDVTTFEVWGALLNGLTLGIVDEETLLDPRQLASEIRSKRIATLWLIAPLFNQLVQEQPDMFAGVKQLMIGGDALSAPHVQLARQANPELRIINGYGPTENTSFSTYHWVGDEDADSVPIGRPITNSTAYVCNPEGQLLPPGVVGELYVGGPGVARGYLNQPELTTSKFVPDPFSSEPQARLYRTGDLVRWRRDGRIDFLGRVDHQVKIRGFRVELGEIENAVSSHEGVKQVIVLVKQDGNQKRLIAYLVAKDAAAGQAALVGSIVAKLQASLPDYMVPAAFVMLDSMPRNANGKIDRARLPEPGPSAYAHSAYAEPANERERILWSIWQQALGIDSFGVTDDFFAIGGDSILAIQVVSRAARQGLVLTPRLIIEAKTIRNLAGKLTDSLAQSGATTGGRAPAADQMMKGEQRLLPIQLKFLQEDRVDTNHYCQYARLALPVGVSRDTLRSALAAIVARHDVLRLKFRETLGGWVAQYRPELLGGAQDLLDECFAEEDLTNIPDSEALIERAQAGLDIKQGRLCRWVWLRGNSEQQLLWVMHHLIVDGVSWRVLSDDLRTALEQLSRGEQPALGAKSSSYQEWAARVHTYAYSPALEREKGYWLDQLALPAARVKFDAIVGDDASDAGQPREATTAQIEVALSVAETSRLLHRANVYYGTQTHELLIAALSRTLGEWLESDDVRIDLEGHGREDRHAEESFEGADLSQTVGWFTTLYPVHLADTRADLGTHIRRTREQLAAVPRNGIGYGVLNMVAHDEELGAARERLGAQESDVLFNYLGQFAGTQQGGSYTSPRRHRTHALRINGVVRAGTLSFQFDYSTQQFKEVTLQRVAERFVAALREIIEHCAGASADITASPFPLAGLSQAQIAALQAQYPRVEDIYPCTEMQQGLLLFTSREPDSGVYLTQLRLELEGIDPDRLRFSWQVLMNRHGMLRTAFVDVGQSSLLQLVIGEVALPWRELDARTAVSEEAVQQLLSAERIQPFDVASAPLMRLLLVRVAEQRYCLSWTHHHALLDGWSMALLIKELLEVYTSNGACAAPAPSYGKYIEWLQARDWKAAKHYWQSYFENLDVAASGSLPLASGRTIDADAASPARYEQQMHTLELPADITARLAQLARSESVGLGTLMLAAWGLLLSKYNGEQEVLFGYATSGRPADLEGSESVVGLFINSLPIRLKIAGNATLAAWLKDIQRRQLDHDDHGFLALADIQRCSGARAGQTLFDSLVVVENYPLDRSALSANSDRGPRIIGVAGVEQNNFALNLAVYPGERLTLKLAHQRRLFDAAATATMLRYLGQLLTSFAKGSAQPISQLSLLTDEEQERAIRHWNDTRRPYPQDRCLHELFLEQARVRDQACALVMHDERWSYRELATRVDAIAAWLAREGVRPGDRIALSLNKQPDLIAAMLGILRAGAAYVPIAVDCPAPRRAFMVADAGIKRVVTKKELHERVATADVAALFLEDVAGPAALDETCPPRVDASATAYVIYTSGTTGEPKGVQISQRNLVNFCRWCHDTALFKAGDAMTQFAPFTFDASAGEIFGGLLAGVELHLLDESLLQDPAGVARYLADHAIRFAAFPPPYLEQIAPDAVGEGLTLLTAGSAPSVELVRRWAGRCRYVNGYGPTETTILSSAWNGDLSELQGGALPPIGKPINNTFLYVVDSVGQLCAPGLVGEIVIGGAGVAQGYLNRPDLNQRHFGDDLWNRGGRLYRTGDLGCWREDGTIEFAGRRDRQVKLRGFRIELNEIELRLLQHPRVKEAVVAVRGDGADKQLLAWVTPQGERADADASELSQALRGFLKQSLPEYMLPQAIVWLERLPLTANGKLDEKVLPAPDAATLTDKQHVAPRTATEARLVALWASVLKLRPEQISATANFFEIGGHSLSAVRLVNAIAQSFDRQIAIRRVFDHAVLADLAAYLQRQEIAPVVAIPVADRSGLLPLSYSQQRLWFIHQLEPGKAQYNQPLALSLRGALNPQALQSALDAIVARHEVLRTTFLCVEGRVQQQIQPPRAVPMPLSDLSSMPTSARAGQVERASLAEAVATFDLSTDLMLRAHLLRLSQAEHVLLLTLHHIASDGWSLSILLKEFASLYESFSVGRNHSLQGLPIQYADYAAWQKSVRAGDLQQQLDYWKRELRGLPQVHGLPLDKPRPAQQSYQGACFEHALDETLGAALQRLAQSRQATLFMVLNAAFAHLLSRYSGESDIVVGTTIANRDSAQTAPLIGFFVNTLLLRTDVSGNPSFAQLLRQCRDKALGAYAHQQLPFDLLVDELQPQRSLSYNPLFQVMLSLENIDSTRQIALPELTLSHIEASNATTAQFDLTLDVMQAEDQLQLRWTYATDLFESTTIQRLAGHFERLLQGISADPECPLNRLSLLSDAERSYLLRDLNDTRQPELIRATWPELFAAQVERTPDAMAVVCSERGQDRTLTYRQLQSRADDVASALRARGVVPGELIALLDERGIDLLVMIVAVLNSGAAYLPLDPTHPPQRWLEILEQAGPRVLLVGGGLDEASAGLSRNWQSEKVIALATLLQGARAPVARNYPALDDLAYVIYTSGSTGKPKGVMIEHRGMINNMRAKFAPLSLTAEDVIAQTASQCFDISVWQFLTALLLGARVAILPNEVTRDPRSLLQALRRERVSVWEPVPSVMQAVLACGQSLPSLRWVMPTGEALNASLVARWFTQYPQVPLMNAYGPAECSDDVAFQPIHAPVERVLIGKPVANAQLYVVDEDLALVPLGAVGELAISGPVVGRGYLNLPEQTAVAFRNNPYACAHADQDHFDQRLYLTGDLVRRCGDGAIEYLGRKDFQIKLRGFRIEIGEIEAHLNRHPQVQQAVVAVHQPAHADPQLADKQLIAYVVPSPGADRAQLTRENLCSHLRVELPEYMIPGAFMVLDALPLTANGKVDRKALPAPQEDQLKAEYQAPEGDHEQILASLWQALLKIQRVGRRDNFFALGGHSLIIMELIASLRRQGLSLELRSVFDAADLAELAARLTPASDEQLHVVPPNLIPADCQTIRSDMLPLVELSAAHIDRIAGSVPGGCANIQDIYPLAPLQEGILFHHLVRDAGDPYVNSVLLRFDTRGRLDQYLAALQQLIDRHDTLRSAVLWEGLPRAVQVVHRQAPLQVEEIQLDAARNVIEQFDILMELSERYIDLRKAPILRIQVAEAVAGGWYLLQHQHHITCDQVSTELEFQEIQALLTGRGAQLSAPVPYREFVSQVLARAQRVDAQAYFKASLGDVQEPTAPFDLLDIYRGKSNTEEVAEKLDADLSASIRGQCQQRGLSPAALFHLAWALVLAQCSRRDDVVFGTVMSGRLQATRQADKAFGLYINMLPLRLVLGGQTVRQALLNVRDKLVELLKYEHVSLLEAQRCSGVPGSTPLFSAVLNYRHEADRHHDGEVLQGIEVIKSPQDVSNYLFDLSISDDGQGFLLVASIAQDIGAQRVMSYVQEALRKIVHALQSASAAPLLSLSILPERELHQLVYEFNDTARPEFMDATWPELFAAQVARTPGRIAVQCEAQQLSYQALEERSNQLARALRDRGAAAGQIIGVLDQRGTDLLLMIVSVLKAGAAYMPLDPSHPSQRWLEVLQEGQPLLLVMGDSLASENRWLKRKWSASSVLSFSELLASAPSTTPGAVPEFPRLHDLAYVLFTSGSTGKPKGVMIEHRGMINNMRSKFEPLSLNEHDVIAQTASQCFDISVWQFLTAPLLGAKVSILSNATARDPEALLNCIQAQGITIWEPVPSVIQAALPFGKPLPSLRWVIPTGEALSEALVSRWFEHYPGIPLMNAYGPAECSDDVSYQPIVGPVAKVLIGKPVANARLHVVDENLLLLPIGVAGELAISGPVVGRGYLNSPEQTQAAFKVNPYARDQADTRLYLTGDLAKRLPDGSLEFVGRKDFQVKIRGFRIELGEIESCLSRHPGVLQAVVTAWQSDRGDKQLVAYVIRPAENPAGAESLRAHLRSMLPDYMVPGAIVMLETLPLTPNGKVDRKALPAPGPAAFQSVAYAAPEGTAEQVLAQVWRDILRVEQVGRHDNFFDLGGNSILIIRMISELAEHGLALTVNDVYQLRTVEACAAAVAAGKQDLSSLLRQHAIRHRQFKLHGDAGPAILLIDRSHQQQHVQLQRILAAADKDTLPAFVRFSDDLQAAETSISTLGLAALSQGSEPQAGNLAHVLAQQIDAFQNALMSAQREETFPFSPMQQDFLKWPLRETFTWVTVAGWYAEEDLKRAFHQLACEQDLLRALLDSSRMQWQLLRADSFAGLCPCVSFKGSSDSRVELERRAGELLAQLRDRQRASGLPYLPLWISASDTEHHFLIANDHLISDDITGGVLENRLAALLNRSARPPERTYRDYVRDTWLKANQQTYDALAERFDYATLGPVVKKTARALRKRARLPLRSVSLRVPLDPGIDAIDQAFQCFKQAAMYLTRLGTVGALVHQYGRQLGSHVYFDQVGLFLDKIPLAIGAGTLIAQLSDRSGYLQQEGINLMSLEQAPGIKRRFALPDLAHAMAFNFMAQNVGPAFQHEADPQFDADRTAKNLEHFRGFLFEAYCARQDLMIHCAFRGRPQEEQALMEAVQKVRSYDSLQPASERRQVAEARMIDALEVKDVHKSYGDFAAVKGVSFRVKQGTCFGILGPNGAGKTSLLGMIEGITPITAGSIAVLGMDVATQIKQIQPRVGVQLQQNNYFQFLTVAELLRFYQELRAAVAGRTKRRAIDSLLDRLDLRPKLNSLVDELSGGQKQRLSIAIALLEDPDVIFLDEPTSALDPHSRLHIWEFIEQLKQNPGKTVILTTHYMEEAERLCDEIMIMNDGKIIAQGNPAQLVSSLGAQHSIQFQFAKGQFKLEFIKDLVNVIDSKWDDRTGYLEVRTRQVAETVREILAVSATRRVKLVNFDINRPSLEDVFLSHTNKELQK